MILFPQTSNSSRQEALLLYVFEDNEAVIKMIIKGRSPTMRHVSRTHRVALDWLFDRINLDPKIQIKYIDTKNQLADILTKGNFTRDEWNHLSCLFNISHFSSSVCSDTMAKRFQQDSGEERVTAKSKLYDESYCEDAIGRVVFNFIEPGEERYYGKQDPWKSVVADDRSGQPDGLSLKQIIQNWIMTVLGLLKSGKVRLRRVIDQGNLIMSTLKKRQIPQISSWEVMQQNL